MNLTAKKANMWITILKFNELFLNKKPKQCDENFFLATNGAIQLCRSRTVPKKISSRVPKMKKKLFNSDESFFVQ